MRVVDISEESMAHKYKLRQQVRLSTSHRQAGGSEIYEVVRLMPADQTGEVSYRIKGSTAERAVRESEITAV